MEWAEPDAVFRRAIAEDFLLPPLLVLCLVLSHEYLDAGLRYVHVYVLDGREAVQPEARERPKRGYAHLFWRQLVPRGAYPDGRALLSS